MHEGCILWGSRVVVPQQGRESVLQQLHEGHPEITRMKSLARMYVWWPGINQEIERCVRTCHECQVNQSSPPVTPMHGSGPHGLGSDYIWTMQVRSLIECF